MAVIVTTLSYDQLSVLIKEKKVSLDNENLILGACYEEIQAYVKERLGGTGFVMAIRGRINPVSVRLLAALDKGLRGNKVIIEAPVDDDDMLTFDVTGLDKAVEIINYGLSKELVEEALDEAQESLQEGAVLVACTPCIRKCSNIRITSLNRVVDIDDADITFVKLGGDGQ